MRQARRSARSMFGIMIVIFMLTACMGVPGNHHRESEPILWLYQAEADDPTAALLVKTADDTAMKIADGVLPGSHREWNGNVIFLNERSELIFAGLQQGPHKLFDHIRPYSYGFLDNGRKLFAVTQDNRLILKSFGAEEQVLTDQTMHVVPLDAELLVWRADGSVHTFNYAGEGSLLAGNAVGLTATGSGTHALIKVPSGMLVTDGTDIVMALDSAAVGPVHISADGHIAVYLDRYDSESGTGVLTWLGHRDEGTGQNNQGSGVIAERVGQFGLTANHTVWYVLDHDLYTYDLNRQARQRIAEGVRDIAYAEPDGSIAAVMTDGRLVSVDENQALHVVVSEDNVLWAGAFASGILYALEDGTLHYTMDDNEALFAGLYDHWLLDNRYIIALQQNEVVAMDEQLETHILTDEADQYRYIYYGDRLLAERLLRVGDLAGLWNTVSGEYVEIKAIGRMKGTIAFGGEDPQPFTVRYATAAQMRLSIAGNPDQPLDLRLDNEGRLVVIKGEEEMFYEPADLR